ncbi:transport inhibitor response 1-like protein [Tanacetum coccineum]
MTDSGSTDPTRTPQLPEVFLKRTFSLINSNSDRNSVSLVCKDWYNFERLPSTRVNQNCYAVLPRDRRQQGFPVIRPWLSVFATAYPLLEELRLKRMTVSDESLEFLGMNFDAFKALSMLSCDGFSTIGFEKLMPTYSKNLTELDLQENVINDLGGDWLSFFPENLTSLEVLNFATLSSEVSFDVLESLVSRSKSLRVLKVNQKVTLDQLKKLLVLAPQLTELGTGTLSENLVSSSVNEAGKCIHYSELGADELEQILTHCKRLTRLWVLDTVGDKGLEAVGSHCPLLEELRVLPADPFDPQSGVSESGLVAVSNGCPKLYYILYFCHRMTNAAIVAVAQNCPDFTHFRLCIMKPHEPDYLTNEPMEETFGSSDSGMEYVMRGCPKLKRLEIRDCPFGDSALLSGLSQYESMRSLWMSACNLTMNGCKKLAEEKAMLNVEVIKDEDGDDSLANKVYVYRTVAGPRKDAPPFVQTL